jgi:thioredoxin-like negative regulator of GroEL
MGWLDKIFGGPKVHPTPVRTREQFDALVRDTELPVIVDVWSESCAPCKRLVPVLVGLATKYEGRLRVVEISTTADRGLLMDLGVRATPTIIIYDAGEEFGRVTGYRPPSWFEGMIAEEFPEVLEGTPT